MMAADPNIFQQYLQPVRSVSDYAADMDKRDANQLALAAQRQQGEIAGFQMQQAKADMAEKAAARNELQRAMAGWTSATTPADRAASLRNSRSPDLWKQADAIEAGQRGAMKDQAEIDHTRGKTAKDAAETAAKTADAAYEKVQRHAQNIEWVRNDADIAAYVDAGIANGVPGFTPQMREQALAKARELGGVEQWKKAAFAGAVPVVERFKSQADAARAQLAADTQIKTTGMNNATSRANNASSNAVTMRGQNMTDARTRESNSASMSKPFEVTGEDGKPVLVQQDKQGNIRAVEGYTPKAGKGEVVPASMNKSYIENRQSASDLDRAIGLAEKNPKAFGASNYVPGSQYFDQKGVDARAAVANVGSLLIHDRSGAAVTVAEMPRLAPFIPAATDKPETVTKKLKQLKEAVEQSGGLMIEAYPSLGKRASAPKSGASPTADPVADALKKYGG